VAYVKTSNYETIAELSSELQSSLPTVTKVINELLSEDIIYSPNLQNK
jgi:Mn-dependent DtxR family transcriptional regulator